MTEHGGVEHREIVVVGCGIAGIGMGLALRRTARDFLLLEKADEVGGTWHDARYPGAECDVAAHLYSFASRPNPTWSSVFAGAEEIRAYLRDCVDSSGLRDRIRTGVAVQRAEYDPATARWTLALSSAGGESSTMTADALVLAVGVLHDPVIPDFPGLATFAGSVEHTATWDASASPRGRRIGVVGTGASGVQIVPALAAEAEHLTVFQRRAPWVIPRGNEPYGDGRIARFQKSPLALRLHRAALALQESARTLVFVIQPRLLRVLAGVARKHLQRSVPDPELRERLTPSDSIGCRRVTISDDFYPALMREDVELVDSAITRVERDGVVTADGAFHELDRLVLATGFDPVGSYRRIPTIGTSGRVLGDQFDAEGRTYLGVTAPGFPNLFLLLGPNTSIDHRSTVPVAEAQIELVLRILDERDRRDAAAVEVSPEAVDRFMDEIDRRSSRGVWLSGCDSWYLDRAGRNRALWPGTVPGYRRRLAHDGFDAYDFAPAGELSS